MSAVLESRYRLRPMRRADVESVCAIEQRSYPFPWSKGIFSDCLRIGYCCRVADLAGKLGGYAILSSGAGESHLLNLCVDPDHRRRGLAQLMLDGLLVDARLLGAKRMFLEVRPSNRAAMLLYGNNGFRVIGRRPDYYPDEVGREDALVMVRHLEEEHD